MIQGSHWPIPLDKLLDGSIIALKNADKLAEESKILYNQGKFSRAISLATLSLEEFGKHCMLQDALETRKTITQKIWKEEFENHEEKLKAIPYRLKKFSDPKDLAKLKRLEKIKQYLLTLSKQKLQGLYVDWDAKNNNWFFWEYTEPSSSIKKDVDEAVNNALSVIEKYLSDVGGDRDLILTTTSEIVKLLQQKKIHSFCEKCSRVMTTDKEFGAHSRICGHITQWFWNN